MNKITKIEDFYLELHSIQNLFEVLLQSMYYCQENDIITANNLELAVLIQEKIYNLMQKTENFLSET